MLSLSVDVGDWIHKGLKKSAKEVVEHADFEEYLDDLVENKKITKDQKIKVIDELEDVAGLTAKQLKMAKKMWKDFSYDDLMKIPPTKKPCFLAGTLVSTEIGLVAIEKLTKGQKIHTYNFKTNTIELQSIVKLYTNKTEKYLKIYVQNSTIKATGNHRFWLPMVEKWVAASQLKIVDMLLTQEGELVQINKLEIIDNIKNTYNLEIENNPNYYVGKSKILVHNTNKVSIFESTELINVEFYRIVQEIGDNIKSLYVGQTIQGIGKRFDQHKLDPKKVSWKNQMDGVLKIKINGKKGSIKMTPYEAAVTETYEINYRGGKRKGSAGLYNKQNPIGKKKFNKFKDLGFNPCKFYV